MLKSINQLVFFALFGMLVHFQLMLWSGDKSLFSIFITDSRLVRQLDLNINLKQDNASLRKEVDALRSSDAILEQQARLRLGYTKPGEVYYSY